jgi:hypothetical protein
MDYVTMLNTIRANAGAEYAARVPAATIANIAAVGNPILTYAPVQNTFLSLLINKIALTDVRSKHFKNPLAKLKSGGFIHGTDVEELYVNPTAATTFDPTGANLLATSNPVEFVNWHRLNRQDVFKVTIRDQQLRHAFTNGNAFQQFYNSIISQLYNGDEIAEMTLMLNTLSDGITSGSIRSAEITVPALATAAERAALLLKTIKLYSGQMAWPSANFNGYQEVNSTYALTLDVALNPAKTYYVVSAGPPAIYTAVLAADLDVLDIGTYYERTTTVGAVETWTPKAEQVLFITTDALLDMNMDYLAGVFNLSRADLDKILIEVPHLGRDNSAYAVLADKNLMRVYDNLYETRNFINPEGLYTNFYLHHWQLYSLSTFSNAIAFREA